MNQRILVITDDTGGSREDANVYYSRYYLVTAPTGKNFSETIFNRSSAEGNDKKIIADIQALGYTVVEPDSTILTIGYDDEGDFDDDEDEEDEFSDEPPAAPRSVKMVGIGDILGNLKRKK